MPGASDAGQTEPNHERGNPWRYRTKSNRGLWVEPTTYAIEAAGTPARLMTVKDVTDHIIYQTKIERTQRQLEGVVAQKTNELQTSNAQWDTLLEALPQFVWSARLDGSFEHLSNQWAEYTGVPRLDLMGSGWLNTLHPADRQQAESSWLTALETGSRFDVDYRIRAKDGTYHWFRAQGIPVRAAAGDAITQWMGISAEKEDRRVATEGPELALT
jgi:PAS domain S-box-containing protein